MGVTRHPPLHPYYEALAPGQPRGRDVDIAAVPPARSYLTPPRPPV